MPKRKHVNRVHEAPRTDANQGVKEHIERVRKQNEYIARKIAEFRAKQEMEAEKARQALQTSTSQTIDGLGKDEDSSMTV